MATMAAAPKDLVRLLDAGAGVGSLAAALIADLAQRTIPPRHISVTCFEIDAGLREDLRATLDDCCAAAEPDGLDVSYLIRSEDYVGAAVAALDGSLFAVQPVECDVAILNPPYLKLSGQGPTRQLLRQVGVEAGNMYAAFLALTARMMPVGGEMVTITPRSFFNGPYFRSFRAQFLGLMSIARIHSFSSRSLTFKEDAVLQENVILRAVRGVPQADKVIVSESQQPGDPVAKAEVDFRRIVRPDDDDRFIRILLSDDDIRVADAIQRLPCSLAELGIAVSTGPVVDFRSRSRLQSDPGVDTAPLIYPGHLAEGRVRWPRAGWKKPNAFVTSPDSAKLLVKAGPYVVVKRFTAREERRRLVAAVLSPQDVPGSTYAIENHLNYYHALGEPLDEDLAWGLCAFLNSSHVDSYFRQFSGHTQVNATDLRCLRYPGLAALCRLGTLVRSSLPDQSALDATVESLILAA